MAKNLTADQTVALDRLRLIFPKGSTVTTIVRHVSQSGMSRAIQVVGTDPTDGEIVDATYLLIRAGLGKRFGNHEGIKVEGCGMDMSFHTVYTLASTLYEDGYALNKRSL